MGCHSGSALLNGNHSGSALLNGYHSALVILAPPNTYLRDINSTASYPLSSPAPHITATVNMPPKTSAKRKAPASVAAPLPDEPKFKRGTRNSAAEQIEVDSDLEDMDDGSQSTAPLSSLQEPSLSPPSTTNETGSTEAGNSQSSVSVYTTPMRSSPPKTQKASIPGPPPAFSGTVGSSDCWHPDFPADLIEAKVYHPWRLWCAIF
jgi:hypothetical protein